MESSIERMGENYSWVWQKGDVDSRLCRVPSGYRAACKLVVQPPLTPPSL
ncbi:hypothetical protein [Microbulbifer sp. JMSA008]